MKAREVPTLCVWGEICLGFLFGVSMFMPETVVEDGRRFQMLFLPAHL